jgi:F-type H+-transporting ATPase subunit epsilon
MDDAVNKNRIHLQIITPRGLKFDQWADMLIFRCIDGDMGVLPGHDHATVAMGDGILRIIDGDAQQKLAVFGGVATVQNNTVKILTTIAQRPDEIDRDRAERDRRRMDPLLQEKADDLQIQSYQVLLRRALVRIEVHQGDEG